MTGVQTCALPIYSKLGKVFFVFVFIFYFYFGCVGSLLLCAGFLWLGRAGATLRCGAVASLVVEHGL